MFSCFLKKNLMKPETCSKQTKNLLDLVDLFCFHFLGDENLNFNAHNLLRVVRFPFKNDRKPSFWQPLLVLEEDMLNLFNSGES